MIISALMNLIYAVLYALTSVIQIPDLPDGVQSVIDTFIGYVQNGLGIVAAYVDLDYLVTLLGVIIAVDLGIYLYRFIMWVVKKIPMLNVS